MNETKTRNEDLPVHRSSGSLDGRVRDKVEIVLEWRGSSSLHRCTREGIVVPVTALRVEAVVVAFSIYKDVNGMSSLGLVLPCLPP